MKVEIKNIISSQFHPEAQEFVITIIDKIYSNEWGVGKDQLAMSLLNLSNGSLDKLLSYFPITDPRDIIMEAS
jgi:hypothetical protein